MQIQTELYFTLVQLNANQKTHLIQSKGTFKHIFYASCKSAFVGPVELRNQKHPRVIDVEGSQADSDTGITLQTRCRGRVYKNTLHMRVWILLSILGFSVFLFHFAWSPAVISLFLMKSTTLSLKEKKTNSINSMKAWTHAASTVQAGGGVGNFLCTLWAP